MKAKVVKLSDIAKGNSRMCLSAKRVNGDCHRCPNYDHCESKVVNQKTKQYDKTKSEIRTLEMQIDKLREHLDEI